MDNVQATGIQLHIVTGRKCWFYQGDPSLVSKICNDIDGQLFKKASLVIEGIEEVAAFPGRSLIGITVLVDPLPASFYARERLSKTIVTQISPEKFKYRKLGLAAKHEGRRSVLLSEIEFASGEMLFLEFNEIAVSGMDERRVLNHLFSLPAITCRRLDGGFSIWNTAHIVSWSHYPKLQAPQDAWQAESFAVPSKSDGKLIATI